MYESPFPPYSQIKEKLKDKLKVMTASKSIALVSENNDVIYCHILRGLTIQKSQYFKVFQVFHYFEKASHLIWGIICQYSEIQGYYFEELSHFKLVSFAG